MLIEARLAKNPVKSVLLLGDGAANWLPNPDAEQQISRLQIPSLGEMIAQPQLKAVAWQRLQSLLPIAG